ncbi:undecaprenyl-phosphate glucose phosphotransferase [Frateuria soli]|uniref:undecaprenyl-phosphate glucose phosphotransferase n=1 Tax=Frateuria soli TaxID=1542730 RepID=UPI001E3C62AF|nr:undecaprenyl-phosphate glucose phosphotransferase [Frateuria soli]UGB38277.1 undecaprenyl-phosphate glucose phosphotransferase [Frateuria soli]
MLLTAHPLSRPHPESAFLSRYAALLDILLRVGDIAIVVGTAVLCHRLRLGEWAMAAPYPVAVLVAVLLVLIVFPMCGIYRSWRGESLASESLRLAAAWLGVIVLLTVLNAAVKYADDFSRLWAAGWIAGTPLLLCLHRWTARYAIGRLRALGLDTRSVVLVGSTPAGKRILEATRKSPWMGLNVEGYVTTPYDHEPDLALPCVGDLDHFLARLRDHAPDQIWVALPMRAEALIARLMEATADIPTTVRLVPDMFGYELINHHAGNVAGVPVITLRGSRVVGHARVIKAVEDRVLAALFLLLLAPLMLLIAVAVKFSSPGPIIYRQERHGLGGKEIEVWKFRSMRVHQEDEGKITQATRDDARVTAVGRFLRRSSLDELPQFINVLQGRMSIVGPRPHALAHNRQYSEQLRGYMQRHGTKPGITGLAQVRGFRGETNTLDKMASRVELDILYINRWTPWLDLKIILLTPVALLKSTNAY